MHFDENSYKYPIFRNEIKRPYQSVDVIDIEFDDNDDSRGFGGGYSDEDVSSVSSRERRMKP